MYVYMYVCYISTLLKTDKKNDRQKNELHIFSEKKKTTTNTTKHQKKRRGVKKKKKKKKNNETQ